jgi:antitoxin component YwqK of YwqJK toxin-antitoxin module
LLYEGYFIEDKIESEIAVVYHYNGAVKYTGGYKKGRREGLGKIFHMKGALR